MSKNTYDYLEQKYNFKESELESIIGRIDELNESLKNINNIIEDKGIGNQNPFKMHNE